MTEKTRWWRPSPATRRRNDAWVRLHPIRYGLIWGCGFAILSFGVNFAFDGRPLSSPKDLVVLVVSAIIGGLVSGLVGGALLAWWFKRHEHDA